VSTNQPSKLRAETGEPLLDVADLQEDLGDPSGRIRWCSVHAGRIGRDPQPTVNGAGGGLYSARIERPLSAVGASTGDSVDMRVSRAMGPRDCTLSFDETRSPHTVRVLQLRSRPRWHPIRP
jgi:hypothetical protein